MLLEEKLFLRKRAIIETINGQSKNILNIDHSRHRSLWNFLGNVRIDSFRPAIKETVFKSQKPCSELGWLTLLTNCR
ncbi:MAG: transposase [Actinomycetota bacterium]